MLFYPGTMEHAETISMEALVLDHGLCSIALRAQEGLRVTPDLLSLELMRKVGPGGTFLGLPETAREMFSELLVRGLWDRQRRSDWEADGSPSRASVAQAEVERILAVSPRSLPEPVEKNLADVISDIAKREENPQLVDLLSVAE